MSLQAVFRTRLCKRTVSCDERLVALRAGPDDDASRHILDRYVAASVQSLENLLVKADGTRLARAKTPIIAITDSVFSPLTEFASEWFEVPEADHAGFRSLAATMALAMTLVISVGKARQG